MNLLFSIPKTGDRVRIATGIGYVAAATKEAGHKTYGIKLNYCKSIQGNQALADEIVTNDIDAVLIGGTSPDYPEVEKILLITDFGELDPKS